MIRMGMGAVALAAAIIAPAVAHAQSAAGLNNKSITVAWTETRSQRDAGQPAFRQVSLPFTMTIYVSSQGRPFTRVTSIAASGRRTGTNEGVGGGTKSDDGRVRNVQVRGNTISHTVNSGGLGRRVQITVNGSSCSASVVTGKSPGASSATTRSVATGGQVEFQSVSAGAASCSVREGNAFAS